MAFQERSNHIRFHLKYWGTLPPLSLSHFKFMMCSLNGNFYSYCTYLHTFLIFAVILLALFISNYFYYILSSFHMLSWCFDFKLWQNNFFYIFCISLFIQQGHPSVQREQSQKHKTFANQSYREWCTGAATALSQVMSWLWWNYMFIRGEGIS